jgi:carboxypeptidase C (cathepsin A)
MLPSHQVSSAVILVSRNQHASNTHPDRHIAAYLDRPSVRTQIGVDPTITANFSACNYDVTAAFRSALDEYYPTYHYVAALLERGVQALIYVGKYDWGCNHVGNEAWTTALEWSGREAFAAQPLREWIVDGKTAGSVRSAKGLTFLKVEGAGHMVSCHLMLH